MSVGFTDNDEETMRLKGYLVAESEFGKVYFPEKGLVFDEKAMIKRMEYPWITCLEVEGITIDKGALK